MTNREAEERIDLERAAYSMLLCGAATIPVAAAALRWPETALVLGTVAAGGLIGTFGVFDLAAASMSGTLLSVRVYFVGQGAMSMLFGVLTASIPVADPGVAVRLSVAWLVLQTAFLSLVAWRVWHRRVLRLPLTAGLAITVVSAVLLALNAPLSIMGLMYAAAGYAALFGIESVVAGLLIHRAVVAATRPRRPASALHHDPVR